MTEYRSATATEQPQMLGPRRVLVRALTYDQGPDTYGTTWKRGVFEASLRSGRTICACWNHDKGRVIGKVVGHRDQPSGLDLEIELADPAAVPDARMVQALLRDGIATECSVSFSDGVTEADPTHRGARRFIRATLQEISLVAAASVPGARVLAMRSAGAVRTRPMPDWMTETKLLLAQLTSTPVTAEERTRASANRAVAPAITHTARPDVFGPGAPPPGMDLQGNWTVMQSQPEPTRFVPMPDDPTDEQLRAFGVGVPIPRPSDPDPRPKVSRALYEAAMSNPLAHPGFDPTARYRIVD